MVALLALWFAAQSPADVKPMVAASHLAVLAREYATSWCPPRPLAVAWPAGRGGGQGAPQGEDDYDRWVDYVTAHIRTATPFGSDYPALAERARALVYNVWFDCTKHVHDPVELDLRLNETPAVVGRELFADFASAPPAARAAAAGYIAQAAYPAE